jgi:3-isopropylmalate dehydrogenase
MTRTKKLCCADKEMYWKPRLWRETVQAMERLFEVTVLRICRCMAMRLVQWPNSYDVLITENLFGDILTDEAW